MKEVTMPKLSDTMTEGTVVTWRKEVGSQVERGEIIAEVETDKATMELEAFANGVLLEILVKPGATVPVGTVIALIGSENERAKVHDDAPVTPSVADKPENRSRDSSGLDYEKRPEAGIAPPSARTPLPSASVSKEKESEILAAPVVRRRASELGLDLSKMRGSGPGGRILLEDLEQASGGGTGQDSSRPPTQVKPTTATDQQAITTPDEKAGSQQPTKMREAIARTVSESWRTIPHFSVTTEARMDAAEKFRAKLGEKDQRLSLTALLVKASAQSLTRFPRLNASWLGDRLVNHQEINIGIVVRREDGLLVPVLRNCAELPLLSLAQQTSRLVDRARHGQLSDTELSGGTFAISNLGMYGIHSFVALILPPMAAVLATGTVRDGVIAANGEPVVARMMTLTLSADHRLIDGAYAAEFLQDLKRRLETPEQLADLLESS